MDYLDCIIVGRKGVGWLLTMCITLVGELDENESVLLGSLLDWFEKLM